MVCSMLLKGGNLQSFINWRPVAILKHTYPELLRTRRCKLVFTIQVGGRWSQETATFWRQLALAKAPARPQPDSKLLSPMPWSIGGPPKSPMQLWVPAGIWLLGEHRHKRKPPSHQQRTGQGFSPHQPPAASRPASTEQWLEVGLVSLHIRRCRYINGYNWHMPGNCLLKQQTKPFARKKGREKKQSDCGQNPFSSCARRFSNPIIFFPIHIRR